MADNPAVANKPNLSAQKALAGFSTGYRASVLISSRKYTNSTSTRLFGA
jgi:hypothetical protein